MANNSTTERRNVDVVVMLLLFVLASQLYALTEKKVSNANTASRLATVESLVDYGTFYIDQSRFRKTVDKVKLDGHLISDKPPMLPVATAGIYWLLKNIFDIGFANNTGRVVFYLSFATMGLPLLLALWLLWRSIRKWDTDSLSQLATWMAVAFGCLGVGYAVNLNNHTPAMACLLVAYVTTTAARESGRNLHFAAAGLFLGLLPTVDFPAAAFSAGFLLVLLENDWKRTLLVASPFALVPILAQFYLTYISTGSLVPLYARTELQFFPGSYWYTPQGIDALDEPKWVYLWHMTFGHHGLFTMTPLLGFGFVGLVQVLRERANPLWRDAWIALVGFAVLFAFYFVRTKNYGGVCVGFRWMISAMPLVLLFVANTSERYQHRRWYWPLFGISLMISAYFMMHAMDSPFRRSAFDRWIGAY